MSAHACVMCHCYYLISSILPRARECSHHTERRRQDIDRQEDPALLVISSASMGTASQYMSSRSVSFIRTSVLSSVLQVMSFMWSVSLTLRYQILYHLISQSHTRGFL